jgi:hypothetical protein
LFANHLFTAFTVAERRALAKRFQFLEIDPASVLVEQGGHTSGLFLLLLGRLEVLHWHGELVEQVAEIVEGGAFGNISRLTREPSRCVVRSEPSRSCCRNKSCSS